MDATVLLREFCDAVERQDGKRFADLFCEDGFITTCSTASLPDGRKSPR
jgi:hypothetical protein